VEEEGLVKGVLMVIEVWVLEIVMSM